ncbi:MAG: TetR/AcrR family transcriptional regulator [Polyangiaceae bacterium]
MSQRRRPSEDRQLELADAALRIIATQGIAALSTRSLATEVGLTSGAIFRHFPSLDAVLDAVVGRVESVLDATFPASELAPMDRLRRFIDARSSAVGNQLGILRLVQSEQFLLALPKSGSKRLDACVVKTRHFISDCLTEARATGEIRADLPPETLVPIVMGTIQMLAVSATRPRRRVDARAVTDSLLALLGAPAPRPQPRRRPS